MDIGIDDNEIKERLAKGDLSVLETIWNAYSSDLLGYLIGLLCSLHEAEDALQDVFITISRKRKAVARARKLKPYLFRLSRNIALNRIKKNKQIKERDKKTSNWLGVIGETEESDSRVYQIETALAALPEKQRSVIILKIYRNKTFYEIGEMLNISQNTAGSRYRYGIIKLRTLIKELS